MKIEETWNRKHKVKITSYYDKFLKSLTNTTRCIIQLTLTYTHANIPISQGSEMDKKEERLRGR